ncbi:aldo/keto reductase [Litorivita pollutaquae]|uniref:Aldo/keto reductase n=1 Tax=Litorivita pollutaquae TaxID=2200892 RepID=A0A2V4MN22_9RHOB|nr:aldo/keto reductase [Litorivita pollutaquae]PYC48125.1 aldo/keto reductase [Litorivita pollutaquae]
MPLPKRQLGSHGPMVSSIGLGCMSFAGFFGATDDETSMECLAAADAAGIDFWDTSNLYGFGRSESVIGTYLKQTGAKVTVATKGGIVVKPERRFDNTEDHLRAELEKSLTRLNRDKVELYYIHRRDQSIAIEDVVETLMKFKSEGMIDAYGLSEVAPSTLRRAHAVAPCAAVQNEYSLWTRLPELGLIDTCTALGTAFIPFSPLARGMFGETSVAPETMDQNDWRAVSPRFTEPNYSYNRRQIDGFRSFCQSKGWTTAAGALAWVLDRGYHLIPIPGTRTAAHLSEWLGATDIHLTDADRTEIARLLPAGFAAGDRYSDAQMRGVERYC